MPGTASYLAGIESNAVQLSYGLEATWKTAPATAFTALRMTGETLSGKKSRARPQEIRTDAQEAAAVTQQVTADGDINIALSYGTYDDLFAALLNSSWSSTLTIAGVTGDITVTNPSSISSTTAGKFTNVVVGQWLKLAGFTTPANNGYCRVTAKADAQHLTIAGLTFTTETPAGTAASITNGGYIRNSNTFQSLFIQKEMDATHWLTYAGSQVHQFKLNADQGKFAEGSFSVMAAVEASAITDSSTGGVTAAPTGKIMDTVTGFELLLLDGTAIAATAKNVDLQIVKQGAAADYGVGSSSAQGMRMGLIEVSGTLEVYFKDFTLYAKFTAETAGVLSFALKDAAGSTYMFTIPSATLMNPSITAGGVNTPVMAKFAVEGNPDTTTSSSFQIDRFP